MTDYRARTKPWYGTARWKRLRKQQLFDQPLCELHLKRGELVAASVADHVEPHKGDEDLFWNGKLQSLCKSCHDGDKQSLERTGRPKPVFGADGWPI